MNDADRLHNALCKAWQRLVAVLDGSRFEERDGYFLTVCPVVPVPQFNGVWPTEDASAPQLDAALQEIAELGLPYSVQTRRGRTPSFEAEAERLGLIRETTMPGMLVDATALATFEIEELRIFRANTDDGLARALAIAAEGFGAPPELFAPLYDPAITDVEGLAIYVGSVDGVDVTTGVGFHTGDAVGIFTVATPAAHRGRGYGAAVTAQAVRDGLEEGAEFAYLQSSAMGHSVYRRLGFRDVEEYTLYIAPEAPVVEPV